MENMPEKPSVHPFIEAVRSLRKKSATKTSKADEDKNLRLWLRIQEYCLLLGTTGQKIRTRKSNNGQGCGDNEKYPKISEALFDSKITYDQIIKKIYLQDWNYNDVFKAIMSECVPPNTSGYLIAKTFKIPRRRDNAYAVTKNKSSTTGRTVNCQTVITWSYITGNKTFPIGYVIAENSSGNYALSKADLFLNCGMEKTIDVIDKRSVTLYMDSDFDVDVTFIDKLAKKEKVELDYVLEIAEYFKLALSEDLKDSLRDESKQRAVLEIATELLVNDAQFKNPKNKKFEKVSWSQDSQSSYFCMQKVRVWTENKIFSEDRFLLIEWPLTEIAPTGYWLSNMVYNSSHNQTTIKSMVALVKELSGKYNVFEELRSDYFLCGYHTRKKELFERHAALCFIAYILFNEGNILNIGP